MGLGFVILIGIVFFVILAASYIFLRFLAKEYYFADVLKDAFLALVGVLSILVISLFIIAIGGVGLDYFFPSRIFTNNFGFEPGSDVRILQGSSSWTPFSYSTHLKFQADKKTIEKIVLKDFVERNRKDAVNNSSPEIKEILEQPKSRYFKKDNSSADVYLAYDEQTETAYFSLASFE